MMMQRCLSCYQPIEIPGKDFHPSCCRKLFDKAEPPDLPYSEHEMEKLGLEVIRSQVTITGAQPKLSLEIDDKGVQSARRRFTIVGLWGNFILKPPTPTYPYLPEIEDLTMSLAAVSKIQTVPHSLIRMTSGNLAYITKRIDRNNNAKLPMEDMCQLTERLTEYKYKGSYEQVAKTILRYSDVPALDVVNYYEQVVFSFLTGNADMHLKNFSLIKTPELGYTLSPAYDMVATALVTKDDTEEMALTLNGKKRKITRDDFMASFRLSGLHEKIAASLFQKFTNSIPGWRSLIDTSFLPPELKEGFKVLIMNKAERLELAS